MRKGYIPPHPDDVTAGNTIREALGFEVGARVWIDLFGDDDTVQGTFKRVLWHEESGPIAIQLDSGYTIPWHAVKGYASDGTDRDGTVAS